MTARVQVACAWAAPVGLVLLAAGLLIAGFLPPPPAHDTPDEIAAFYRDNTDTVRTGLLLAFAGVFGWLPLVAVIGRQMLRIGPSNNVLAYVQMLAGAVAWVFLLIPLIILVVASFRPDRNPEITQAIHDLGWIMAIMPFVPFCVQLVAIGVGTLLDPAERAVFPRWVGYLNLWIAVLFLPGAVIVFFKSGAFSYQGLIAFWVPLTAFAAWFVAMTVTVVRAARTEPAAPA